MKSKLPAVIAAAAVAEIPFVAAEGEIASGVQSFFQALLNTGATDQIFIKIGILLVLFGILYKGAQQVFKENRISAVISIVISLLGTRFMPEKWVLLIGSGAGGLATVLLIVGLILAPYSVISAFIKPGWFRRIVSAAATLALLYIISGATYAFPTFGVSLRYFSLIRWPIEFIEDIIYYTRRHPIWATIIAAAVVVGIGVVKQLLKSEKK